MKCFFEYLEKNDVAIWIESLVVISIFFLPKERVMTRVFVLDAFVIMAAITLPHSFNKFKDC